ncbi:MAG: hypothetical protein II488_06195 [Firmicutes bacterium]|nr:hypothetical protein [Bacillota bacterium]MBQ2059349.1 hypothetical protein [Bacillota bacterium]
MDYSRYTLSRAEKAAYYSAGCAALMCLGLLFYRSILLSAALCLASVPLRRYYEEYLRGRRLRRLLEGFKGLLYSLSASMAAGHQLPDALQEAELSLRGEFGEDSDICLELRAMLNAYYSAHDSIPELFTDFGRRCGQEAVAQFATALAVCTASGGDLETVALRSCGMLLDMLGFEDELSSMFAEKRFDMLVITAMPLIMLSVLNLASASYIAPLYGTLAGRLIMTVSLGLIAASAVWGMRIMDVKV